MKHTVGSNPMVSDLYSTLPIMRLSKRKRRTSNPKTTLLSDGAEVSFAPTDGDLHRGIEGSILGRYWPVSFRLDDLIGQSFRFEAYPPDMSCSSIVKDDIKCRFFIALRR
ncbi:hypothetical protein [Mesorhizobium amorphae]|uniref:hypothetical protein n=1 Tax=Mesorhizobium amorphae TaxID=71433 RepID=UPI0017822035|nr:hypothetical protein [Mesorhizobium amorphae]